MTSIECHNVNFFLSVVTPPPPSPPSPPPSLPKIKYYTAVGSKFSVEVMGGAMGVAVGAEKYYVANL